MTHPTFLALPPPGDTGPLPRLAAAAQRVANAGLMAPLYAAGGVAAIGQLLTGGIVWPVVGVALLVTYASYLIDAASDAPDATATRRTQHVARHRRVALTSGGVAFAAALSLAAAHGGGWLALALLAFPFAVMLYCLPMGPKRLRRVKDIPYAKTFYTAAVWGLLGLWAAIALGHGNDAAALATAYTLFALRDWLNTAFCDLKDVDRDRAAGLQTLATRLGSVRLLRWLGWVDAVSVLLLAAAVAAALLPPMALALACTSPYYQALLRAAARPDADTEWLANVPADAEWVLWPLYLALGALVASLPVF